MDQHAVHIAAGVDPENAPCVIDIQPAWRNEREKHDRKRGTPHPGRASTCVASCAAGTQAKALQQSRPVPECRRCSAGPTLRRGFSEWCGATRRIVAQRHVFISMDVFPEQVSPAPSVVVRGEPLKPSELAHLRRTREWDPRIGCLRKDVSDPVDGPRRPGGACAHGSPSR